MHRRIDPAALLIAVLTVGVDPLTTNGPWEKINTIVAAVVGVILAAYTWPRKVGAEPEASVAPTDNWILAAQEIAYGLIIATDALRVAGAAPAARLGSTTATAPRPRR
jgi:hypothetical protein